MPRPPALLLCLPPAARCRWGMHLRPEAQNEREAGRVSPQPGAEPCPGHTLMWRFGEVNARWCKPLRLGSCYHGKGPKRNEASSTEFHACAGPAASSPSISPQLEQMANPFALRGPGPCAPLPRPANSSPTVTLCYGASGLSAHLSKKHSELLHPRDT